MRCGKYLAITAVIWLAASASIGLAASKVEVREGRLYVDGQPCFFIGINPGPPADLKTPEGGDGWAELAEGGVRAVRGGHAEHDWDEAQEREFRNYLEIAHAHGIGVSPMLKELVRLDKPGRREQLAAFINKYKNHPAIFFWKSTDEPEWGKVPVQPLVEAYQLIRELDPNHPVWFCHAPRGTIETLRPYNDGCNVLSIDIYPVSYPPGKHSLGANKGLSMVGDYTRRVVELAGSTHMKFMVLQGAGWSGVAPAHNPANRLMKPTFRQQRYMMYQAIINGADSLAFFGMTVGLLGRDAELGFDWSWWRAVLRPLLAEIKPGSELYPALIAPDSRYPLEFTGGPQIEARWKDAGIYLYILAAAREGAPVEARFSGLQDGEVTVLFENRTLEAKDGAFSDRFAPNDVHVYRALRRLPPGKGGGPVDTRPGDAGEGSYYQPAAQP